MLDNYDSFTYNLVHLFEELGAEVRVFRNDAITADEAEALAPSHLVVSPNPVATQGQAVLRVASSQDVRVALYDALGREVRVHRIDRVQVERADRLLMHLFQHQIHHRGQAHAMLSATPAAPPQLDEFFSELDEPLRRGDLAALGWDEVEVWR